VIERQIYRNTMFYLVSASASSVKFQPHHSLTGNYRVVYECSREEWEEGKLFK
jgi:hypothetical protein